MTIQVHKESGLSIRDNETKAILYQDSFDNAVLDAELEPVNWPDASIIRIFTLPDGRIAIVRETEAGLSQEAASAELQNLLGLLQSKAEQMQSQKEERLAEANASEDTSDLS